MTRSGAPDLVIAIVSWNTRDMLAACLQSIADDLQRQTTWRVETVVVDNASADGSPQMVSQRFPEVHLVENDRNIGFAPANNQAIRLTDSSYVLMLNSDTSVLPGALTALLEFMEAHPRAGAAGPYLRNAHGGLQFSCRPMLSPGREFLRLIGLDALWPIATYRMDTWSRVEPRPVEVISGACFLLRRAALDQVGLLDDSYFMYTENVDLCYRLARAGWGLWYVPRAQVVHYGGASSRQMRDEMYLQLYRSKTQFYRKFGGQRQADRFKRLIRLAYWPRLVLATVGAPFSGVLAGQARTFRRLLDELPSM
jgi:N-acetylglucosaminyl-diphospho-decaprenol L-rhamnosyltransferase